MQQFAQTGTASGKTKDPIDTSDSPTAKKQKMADDKGHVLVIMGASGDLAKKSIYPALWELYKTSKLPPNLHIIGFARSTLTVKDLRERSSDFLKLESTDKGSDESEKFRKFWSLQSYIPGSYDDIKKAKPLTDAFEEIEKKYKECDRTFYVALPPEVYKSVTELIKKNWMAKKGRTKIALEKPFGTDLESSDELDDHLKERFRDEEIVRIDHYLCLEMVQAILALRFTNRLFLNTWNNKHIASVLITFKEDFGTYGRSGYFEKAGIIRDVMQNHLMQILSLVAMEKPESSSDIDLRKEKARLIRAIRPVVNDDIVLGQYVGNELSQTEDKKRGYKDDEKVPNDSKTPTFATIAFHIDNDRWEGVPFIMRCGKATNEVKDEIRFEFKGINPAMGRLFKNEPIERNELVIQLKPKEKIALRITGKHPGMGMELENTELDLNYASKYSKESLTGPYERLLLSVINDSENSHYVGREELRYSWKLFTPILQMVEARKPIQYTFGSLGPKEADVLCAKHKFYLSTAYPW